MQSVRLTMLRSTAAVAAVLLVLAPTASSAVALADLVGGATIVIGDKVFDRWFAEDFSSVPVNLADIDVVPLVDQPLNPGLMFNANGKLRTTGLDLIDLTLGFTVSTLDGRPTIKDNSLEIVGYSFGPSNVGGVISVFEDVFDAGGALIGEKFVTADNLPPSTFGLFDSAQFAPRSLVSVEKLILISGDAPGDTVSLDSFEQRFSQVPEPATLALVLSAMGIGWFWRRRDQ